MRKLFSFLFCTMSFQLISAQKILSEFTAHYKLSYIKGKSVQLNSDWDLYVKGPLSRVDIKSKSGSETTVLDGKTGTGKIFKEYSGQKLLIHLKKEDWLSLNESMNNTIFEVVATGVSYNGYICNKAVGKTDKQQTVEVLFLPDLVPVNKDYSLAFKQIKGLPVKTMITASGENETISLVYELADLNTDLVTINTFEPNSTGFRVLNYEEMIKNKN